MAPISRSIVAIIPARGGSKGIPNKNLALLGGQPLIAHTIQAALAVPSIARVIVSTDSRQIAEVAKSHGASVPFLRPAELATDEAPGREVWKHAIDWLAEHEGLRPYASILLQPTSPLRTSEDLRNALDLFDKRNADWVVSVSRAKASPEWMTPLGPRGELLGYELKRAATTQRQTAPDLYLPNGAIFLGLTACLKHSPRLYSERTFAYVMPAERSIDIDTPWDLRLAEILMQERTHARAC